MSLELIRNQFLLGLMTSKTHMLIVCDRIENIDEFVFASSVEDCKNKYKECIDSFRQVVEVYDLNDDLERQLASAWTFNIPSGI